MSGARRSALGALLGLVQRRLPLDHIREDVQTQPREAMDIKIIAEYADRMVSGPTGDVVDLQGDVWPPLVVYEDAEAGVYWLVDGYHRLHAARQAHMEQMQAEVYTGTVRDAILHSTRANSSHGLRRTLADERRAVVRLLEDMQWRRWSDREIARRVGCADPVVEALRAELEAAWQIVDQPIIVDEDEIEGIRQHGVALPVSLTPVPTPKPKVKAEELAPLPEEQDVDAATFEGLPRLAGSGAGALLARWQTREELFTLATQAHDALAPGGALLTPAPAGELLSWFILQLHDFTHDARLVGPQIVVIKGEEPWLVWTRGPADVPARSGSPHALAAKLARGTGRVVELRSPDAGAT